MSEYRISLRPQPLVPQHVIDSLIDYTNMLTNGARYTVWYDGQVHRNPNMKPLLHNGKKPR